MLQDELNDISGSSIPTISLRVPPETNNLLSTVDTHCHECPPKDIAFEPNVYFKLPPTSKSIPMLEGGFGNIHQNMIFLNQDRPVHHEESYAHKEFSNEEYNNLNDILKMNGPLAVAMYAHIERKKASNINWLLSKEMAKFEKNFLQERESSTMNAYDPREAVYCAPPKIFKAKNEPCSAGDNIPQ